MSQFRLHRANTIKVKELEMLASRSTVVLKNDVVGRGATAKSIIKEKSTDWVPATSGLRTLLKLVLAATT